MLELHASVQSEDALSVLKTLSMNDFLGGPGRPPHQILVDDIYAGTLENALEALCLDHKVQLDLGNPMADPAWEQIAHHDSFRFLLPQDADGYAWAGVVVADSDNHIVGAYTGCSLAVSDQQKGKGLGRALVSMRFIVDCELPLWEHDEAGYSQAGYAAHVSAYNHLNTLPDPAR